MANDTREVVTLQIGHYANFVGAHWWNIQESSFVYSPSEALGPKEINHDVLFREGHNLKGNVTYTPRLVLFDLKGSLSTLRQEGILYDWPDDDHDLNWMGDVTLHKAVQSEKNEYLQDLDRQEAVYVDGLDVEERKVEKDESDRVSEDSQPQEQQVFGPTKVYNLDDTVRVWSDFLRPHLHPRTVHVVSEYQHGSEMTPFDVFGYGKQLLSEHKISTEVEDRMHFFLEECDRLQGFQVLVDTHDGFGGMASSVLETLRDEYSNKGILTFGLTPTHFSDSPGPRDAHRVLSAMLAYQGLAAHSSALLPLSLASSVWRRPRQPYTLPDLQYKPDLPYHTSAILAAALDTATLMYRQHGIPSPMTQMTDAMTTLGRNVLSLQMALPFPMTTRESLASSLVGLGKQLPWQPLTPHCRAEVHPYSETVTLRGVPAHRVRSAPGPNSPQLYGECKTTDEMLQSYLQQALPQSLSATCVVQQPCKVTAPYPHIFSNGVNSEGFLLPSPPHPQRTLPMESVPVMTSLQTTPSSGDLLQHLHHESSRLDIKKYHHFLDSGLEVDEFREALNDISSLATNYSSSTGNMV